jgi:hypothetical protein
MASDVYLFQQKLLEIQWEVFFLSQKFHIATLSEFFNQVPD